MAPDLLDVRAISKSYGRHRWWNAERPRTVLHEVSLTLARGHTLALVGPSGSGKTTLARCIAGFEQPDRGEILLHGRVQMIFQQPAASLNPRFTAAQLLEEPLVIQRRPRDGAAARAMELVHLPVPALRRRALEFSGGERQRLAIARALVVEPELLILDESFAGLDPRLQQQVAALLRDLQNRLGLALLVISHDLDLVADMAQDLAVMQDGAIVEAGAAGEVLAAPRHPLTCRLVAAAHALSLAAGESPAEAP